MKRYFALALAAAAGGFAATAVSGLYAATVKPIYVVTEIDEITDADGFKNSFQRKDVRAAVEAMVEDGRYIVRTENAIALDGDRAEVFHSHLVPEHEEGKILQRQHERIHGRPSQDDKVPLIHRGRPLKSQSIWTYRKSSDHDPTL